MNKILLVLLLLVVANGVSAQYLYYKDHSKKQPDTRTVEKSTAPETPKPKEEKVIYHDWPDCCPGMKGSIPILVTYVPHELVLKLKEKYQGHLYSIACMKVPTDRTAYKLRICDGNEVKYAFADEEGNLMEL
jgi:hypothetical protein